MSSYGGSSGGYGGAPGTGGDRERERGDRDRDRDRDSENNGGYNPRTHSKVAEKEGFHMGGTDEPRTLYVGNLDSSVTEEFIGTLFGQIGIVTKTKVIFDSSNDPYAFVEFHDHNMAAQALQTMNRRLLLDKEMKVNWAVEPGQQQPKVDTSKHFHVFVGDLSPEVDNKSLKEAFIPFGEVSDAKVIRDAGTQKSKGYGFVSYPKREEAERAIEQMNGQWLGKRTIRTNWATRKPGQSEPTQNSTVHEKSYDDVFNSTTADNSSVYVGNVAGGVTEDEIRDAFSRYGRIPEVRIFKVQGYAFVKFDSKDSACKAIMGMNGGELGGNSIRCSWGKTSDNERRRDGGGGGGGNNYNNHGNYGNGGGYGNNGGGGGYGSGGGGGYGYGGSSNGGGGYGGNSGGPNQGGAGGPPNSASAMAAQQQYWQYYAQYYNNPQMAQQWANYYSQHGGGQGGPPGGGGGSNGSSSNTAGGH